MPVVPDGKDEIFLTLLQTTPKLSIRMVNVS